MIALLNIFNILAYSKSDINDELDDKRIKFYINYMLDCF